MSAKTHAFSGVLFDMDGTLVNTKPLWNEAERMLMAEYGVQWTEADDAHCFGGPASRVLNYMADKVRESGRQRPDPQVFWDGFLRFMGYKLANEPLNVQDGALELLSVTPRTPHNSFRPPQRNKTPPVPANPRVQTIHRTRTTPGSSRRPFSSREPWGNLGFRY